MAKKKLIPKTKRGRISRDEDKRIAEFVKDGITNEEIAQWLNRPVSQIEDYVKRFYGKGEDLPAKASQTAELLRQFRNSSHWKFLKEHYSGDELSYYEELYSNVVEQFQEDIFATEQLQIFQALDAVIMINRHKKARKMVEDQLLEIERLINIEKSAGSYDQERILALESQRQVLAAQSNTRTREFTELAKKFEDTMEKLKGTRQQRIKNIESSRRSWTELIKNMQDRKVREREERRMELIRAATDKKEQELRQPIKYINGDTDQPLLVPEDVRVEVLYGKEENDDGGNSAEATIHGD